jgi:CBS domain-containing protein
MISEENGNRNGMRVGDIRHLLVEKPSVITPDQPISRLLNCILKDPRTRHVYVVDEAGRMVGSVRLNALVRYLFPYESLDTTESAGEVFRILSANCVGDIMSEDFHWVRDSTTLEDLVRIMSEDQVNELPVVDDRMRPIGEINMLEVIMAWSGVGNG